MPELFEKVLDRRLRKWAERVGVLSDLQGGFRSERSTIDQIFILTEIIAKLKECKRPIVLAFLDVRKAYDRVWRDGLWYKLEAAGCGGRCLSMLREMFRRVRRRILVNQSFTEDFDVDVGVPQGSVLSPFLYAVFIDGLHGALRRAGLGVEVYGRLVPLLLYADDIVLLAKDSAELKRMLLVAAAYARTWRFSFNAKKCGIVAFGPAYWWWAY